MGRPRNTREVGGGLILAAGLWTEKDRRNCRNLARKAEGDDRPAAASDPRPPDLEDRIKRHHAAAKAAKAVGRGRGRGKGSRTEPIECWGGCGRALGHGMWPRVHGWHSRRVELEAGPQVEVLCPACFAAAGFIGEDDMPRIGKGRAAVLEDTSTSGYARLTDDHLVVECDDCEKVLLADRHAGELATNPNGLPPLAAGTITLKSGRVLRFCPACIQTRAPKVHGQHTAGVGDRRTDKPLTEDVGPWAENAVRDGEDAEGGAE